MVKAFKSEAIVNRFFFSTHRLLRDNVALVGALPVVQVGRCRVAGQVVPIAATITSKRSAVVVASKIIYRSERSRFDQRLPVRTAE